MRVHVLVDCIYPMCRTAKNIDLKSIRNGISLTNIFPCHICQLSELRYNYEGIWEEDDDNKDEDRDDAENEDYDDYEL